MTKTVVDPRYDLGREPLTRILKDGDRYEIVGAAAPMANILVKFQTGPYQEAGLNGTFVEDLLVIARDRLEEYQAGPFPHRDNAAALAEIEWALFFLNKRTKDRLARGVEGTSAE